ncbi:signal peptidase I [Longicatena caecimuris]|uniref:signal peptidase I n=1 Tax=Longicatena caecimuris TaxID=1796635 RepID=UPI001D0038C2|nr:signal peptidase I [Longicatena caecimuris]MCB5393400.1 signal peptidase I [Longicatena caecimuris]MCB5564355.1 signal peptidase I [Longicatena caecimuris]
MRNLLKQSGKWIFPAIAMLLTFILLKCVFLIGYVPSESMEPTLERGSYIIGCRIYSNLETGDIIIFRRDGKLLVKRIAAIGGDTVEQNGTSMTVPEGCYYVLGDNADNSFDSRYWKEPFVSKDDVVAKAFY